MTLDEAFAVLGVEMSADHDAIRRAYLRRLHACGPERDPEGFKRLRQAFEIAASCRDTDKPVDAPTPAPTTVPAPTDAHADIEACLC